MNKRFVISFWLGKFVVKEYNVSNKLKSKRTFKRVNEFIEYLKRKNEERYGN
jgi:hypothetical protein